MSPAATIDNDEARAAVLQSANAVFYARGIAGVGMADIRDDSGVSLRRLYSLYPSKRELVAAWLTDRHTTWMEWFTSSVDRRSMAGEEPLLAAFDAIAEWAESPGYRGCAFVNSAAETVEIDDTHRRIIAAHKESLLAYLISLARDGGYAEPERLGRMIGVLLDGGMVEAAVLRSCEPIVAARDAAAVLIEASQ
ncbi:TetR/AcrR family transcriptional regulator [Gaiella sp.]|uniref:TetR/AcrR family transcriptional regulator n=1 Tax=Gaiella sp. TaxID=2663207 RepID=UPI003266C5E4